MQSPWFEFVGYGTDFVDTQANSFNNPTDFDILRQFTGVLDKDQVVTFTGVPKDQAYTFGVYANTDERVNGVRPQIIVQGYDATGTWIRTQQNGVWADGIALDINGDTPPFRTATTQTITQVTGIIKPITNGYVFLYIYPADGSSPLHIGTYAPKDTTPTYRKYRIPGLNCAPFPNPPNCPQNYCVRGRCRKRFVPITSDNDYLLISNLPALKAMIQAVYYLESNDPQSYTTNKATAIDILRKEAKAYIGLQRQKPFITFGEGTGVRTDGLYVI
jgi:hypothetical protein